MLATLDAGSRIDLARAWVPTRPGSPDAKRDIADSAEIFEAVTYLTSSERARSLAPIARWTNSGWVPGFATINRRAMYGLQFRGVDLGFGATLAHVARDDMRSGITIVEPGHAGHRLEYVDFVSNLPGVSRSRSILMTSPESLDSDEWRAFGPESRPGRVSPVLHYNHGFRARTLDLWKISRSPTRKILFLNFDEYMVPCILMRIFLFRKSLIGIMMRPPKAGNSKYRSKALSIAILRGLGVRVLELASPLSATAVDSRVVLDPSGFRPHRPTDSAVKSAHLDDLRQWKGRSDLPVVAVVGALTDRKNIPALLAAVERGRMRLVLAGKPDPKIESVLARSSARIGTFHLFLALRRITDEELASTIQAADVVALLYDNEVGSSGVLAHAVTNGRPVVVWGNETLIDVVDRLGIGEVCADLEPASIESAVESTVGRDVAKTWPTWNGIQESWLQRLA